MALGAHGLQKLAQGLARGWSRSNAASAGGKGASGGGGARLTSSGYCAHSTFIWELTACANAAREAASGPPAGAPGCASSILAGIG